MEEIHKFVIHKFVKFRLYYDFGNLIMLIPAESNAETSSQPKTGKYFTFVLALLFLLTANRIR